MFISIVLLLLMGLLLLLVEAFVPGGILGAIGAILIVASAVICYMHYGAAAGTIYLACSLTLALTVGLWAFFTISRRLAISPPEPTGPAGPDLEAWVGTAGRVVKALDPTGFVEIEGKRLQARTQSSEQSIPEGQLVVVTGVDSTFLVVGPWTTEQQTPTDIQ